MNFNTDPDNDPIKYNKWSSMDANELAEQRNSLIDRLDILQTYGYQLGPAVISNMAQLTNTLQQGVAMLDVLIEKLNHPDDNKKSQ